MQTCPKCQYQRQITDEAPEWQCPSCGIAYAKYIEAQSGGGAAARRMSNPAPAPESTSSLKILLAGGFLIALIGFAAWKSQQHPTVVSTVASNAQFDEAKKAFDANLYEAAMKGFGPLADAGNPKAQYYVALIYGFTWTESVNGVEHPADSKMQVQWFTRSAQQGEVLSQVALADFYSRAAPEIAYRTSGTQWNPPQADTSYAEAQYPLNTNFGQDTFTPNDVLQDLPPTQHFIHPRSHPGNVTIIHQR